MTLFLLQVIHVCWWKVSALITGEFYTKKEHFPGFGRPFVFNAKVLLKFVVLTLVGIGIVLYRVHRIINIFVFCRVGRNTEAKDSARVALKSPWWTLGCEYQVFVPRARPYNSASLCMLSVM